jgi:hypothetical protein
MADAESKEQAVSSGAIRSSLGTSSQSVLPPATIKEYVVEQDLPKKMYLHLF